MPLFRRKPQRFLPREAYSGLDETQRETVDTAISNSLHLIPTEPGAYVDRTGDIWTLDSQGRWTDNRGETRSKKWTPYIALIGPMRPLNDED